MSSVPMSPPRAVQHQEWHRHLRLDGSGHYDHTHPLRRAIHGHSERGLRNVDLAFVEYRWRNTENGQAVIGGALFVLAALAIAAVIYLAV